MSLTPLCSKSVASWFTTLLLLLAATSCGRLDESESLLFMGWDTNEVLQLFRTDGSGMPLRLTDFGQGVHDYALAADGRLIALSTTIENGNSEIWIVDAETGSATLLHTCRQAECANMSWAPDARRLLFEQRASAANGLFNAPVLWWLDAQTGVTRPLLGDGSEPGSFARFSPDGNWLSYHSPQKEGLELYNSASGTARFLPNEIGTAAVWHPQQEQLLLPLLDLVILHGEEGEDHEAHEHQYQTAVHLQTFDLKSGELTSLTADLPVEDSVPAWSPDGQWIAFGRRTPGTGAARQLWRMRADGSEARALTEDPLINHGPPLWSADGRTLLFQQIAQNDLASKPQIWRLDVESGEKEQVVSAGMQPSWLFTEQK